MRTQDGKIPTKACLIVALTLAASPAMALMDCLSVDVGGVSRRLVSLTLPKVEFPAGKPKEPVRIEVRAKKDDGGIIVTPFDCTREKQQTICTNPDGAGDFILQTHKGELVFESNYMNFELGAISGMPPRKDEDEIHEDYAMILEDDHSEDTHSELMRLKTESIKCPAPETPSK